MALLAIFLQTAALMSGTVTAAKKGGAEELFQSWLAELEIPGTYTSIEERLAQTQHPGDLSSRENFIFSRREVEQLRSQRRLVGLPTHSPPNPRFADAREPARVNRNSRREKRFRKRRKEALEAIAWLLWRGVSRLQDEVLARFESNSGKNDERLLLSLVRRVLNSYEEFWRQAKFAIGYGPKQLQWPNPNQPGEGVWREYGPETNFWLKFRPTLSCSTMTRLGAPEIGGAKNWCNPEHLFTSNDAASPKKKNVKKRRKRRRFTTP